MTTKKSGVVRCPLALGSEGQLLANAAGFTKRAADPQKVLKLAVKTGLPVFIGVVLPPIERDLALKRLDDAFHEIVAMS